MTVYTFSEARQKFASLLERATREGAVRVKRRDGQVFLIKPEHASRSPLDVEGVDADVSEQEIVNLIREMRQRVATQPSAGRSSRRKKKTPTRRAR